MATTATKVAQGLQIMVQSQIIGKMHHHKGNIKNDFLILKIATDM